jgi:hypothetical protein
VVHDDGTVDRVELTGLVDQGTRTIAAAVLRVTTKAVDAALLLARALTPEPMRQSLPSSAAERPRPLPGALAGEDVGEACGAQVPGCGWLEP